MLIVPLQPIPSQQVNCNLNGQATTISLAQKSTGLFIDVYLNQSLVIGGVICQNLDVIVRSAYLGYSGDLAFYDTTEAGDDPTYGGLGSRYQLYYFAPSELPPGLS